MFRYTLVSGGGPRSKSAERVAMKYRRVSLDPYGYQHPHHQHFGQPPGAAGGQKVRSVSMATAEAGDLHVYNNPQLYR